MRCGSLHDGKFLRGGLGLRGLVSAVSGFLPSSFDKLRMSGHCVTVSLGRAAAWVEGIGGW